MPKKPTIYAADLFCGAGGTSTGLREACKAMGLELDLIAVNHWPIAIDSHKANHPYAEHCCAEIESIDPRKLVPGGRLKLLVASPECTHHANARGGRPMNDQSRASAWHILRWLELLYVDNVLIENVKEFRTWGPLGADGRPLKSKKGETYRAFLNALKGLGYNVEDRVLNAADFGDPTTRQRLFIIARRGNKAIKWPRPTHAPADKAIFRNGVVPWVPARDIIDWTIPGKSIFDRKKPLAEKTLQRIYAGLKKFGGPGAEPFLIVLRDHMGARSVDAPVPTLAASGNHVGLVEPFITAFRGSHAGRQDGEGRNHTLAEPLPTQDCSNRYGVVEPVVVNMKGKSDARSIDEPLPTQTTRNHLYVAEAEAYMLPQHSGGQLRPVSQPAPTICTGGAISLVSPVLVNIDHRGGNGSQTKSVDQPLPTITTKARTALIEADAFIVDVNHGRKVGDHPDKEAACRAQSINQPLKTVTAGRRGKGVVQPCVVKYFGTATAQSVEEPLHTVTAKARYALVTTEQGTFALDIRLRMLRPHELAAAMSLKNYVLTGNMEDQVRQIGNAVPVKLAQALCAQVIS